MEHILESSIDKDFLFFAIIAVLLLLVIYCVLRVGGSLVHTVFALLLPAYHSIKALEASAGALSGAADGAEILAGQAETGRWIRYWIIHALLALIGSVQPLVALLPMFHVLQECVLIWCALPNQWHGTDVIYRELQPLFFKLQEHTTHLFSRPML